MTNLYRGMRHRCSQTPCRTRCTRHT